MSREDRSDHDYAKGAGTGDVRRGRVRRFGGILSGLLTLVLVVMGLAAGAFFYFQVNFTGEGPTTRETTFLVAQGQGLAEIADALLQEGIISDSRMFIAGAFLQNSRGKLKAGEYRFPAGASMEEILATLVEGRSIQHKLTIPEGLTSEQVVQRVLEHPVLVGDVAEIPGEGTILPDTYVFLRGMTRQKLIDRMQKAQESVLAELWPTRTEGLPLKTPKEAVILASIVEKETGRTSERAHVAAVFINRIIRKIRLQSDPTIIYGIVGGKGVLDRPILKTDIAEKTPYNTYQIDGLPPTPIANPGRAAIEAVLRPAKSKDLYFVADGTGGHAFAASLADHRKNVALWRQIEAERRRLQAAEGEVPEESAAADESEMAEPPAVADLPPPPPAPPPAEPAELRRQAAPAPVPQPKPQPEPEVTGSVVASKSLDQPVAEEDPNPPAVGDIRQSMPERRQVVVPKPRPRPDPATGDDAVTENADAAPKDDLPADATPTNVTNIRPTSPRAASTRSTIRHEGYR